MVEFKRLLPNYVFPAKRLLGNFNRGFRCHLNRCDCCVKGWKRENEFGLCLCYCDDCNDRYGICTGRVSICNKYKNHILIYDEPLTNPIFHRYIIKHFINRIQSKYNN
jgi:hypothetical protein